MDLSHLWEVVKDLLVIGLIAGAIVIGIRYVPIIPPPIKTLIIALVVVVAIILAVDQLIPELENL